MKHSSNTYTFKRFISGVNRMKKRYERRKYYKQSKLVSLKFMFFSSPNRTQSLKHNNKIRAYFEQQLEVIRYRNVTEDVTIYFLNVHPRFGICT